MSTGRPTRLPGSGVVSRVLALGLLAAVAASHLWVFYGDLGAVLRSPPAWLMTAAFAVVAIRSLFVGVFLGDGEVLVRGWFRSFRYRPGELRAVEAVPYWRLPGVDSPIRLLRFVPVSGWVREPSTTGATRARAAEHAAAVRRHLGMKEDA